MEGPAINPQGQPGLVSVIVPTYNRAYCVNKSIESALAQTYRNLEVLVIDDGSTDNTREVVTGAFGGEPRVKYIYQSNGGVAVARNRGMRVARGEFIALLDSDDVWKPWKTEVQVAVLRANPNVGMVWTDMEAVDPNGKLIALRFLRRMYGAYRWFPNNRDLFSRQASLPVAIGALAGEASMECVYVGDIFSPMMMGNLVHTSTVLMRRERLISAGLFSEHLRNAGEDYDFHLRTCSEGEVAFVDVASIYYRVGWHDQITVRDYDFFFARGFLKSIRAHLASDKGRITLPKTMLDAVQAQAHGWVGTALMDRGKRRVARRFILESFRYRLWQPHIFLAFLRVAMPRSVESCLVNGARAAKRLVKLHSTKG